MKNILITSLIPLSYLVHCHAQEDGKFSRYVEDQLYSCNNYSEQTAPRLLSNENTAAVTGAALGLGIGIAGSILVGKLIEDATKCKPQNQQPPAFGR